MGVKRPRPAIASGTPRAPSNNFTQQINLQIYKDYATPKIPGLREKPLPATGAEPRPVREPLRAPRALQTNSTQQIERPSFGQGHNSPPDPVTIVGHPNLLTIKYK